MKWLAGTPDRDGKPRVWTAGDRRIVRVSHRDADVYVCWRGDNVAMCVASLEEAAGKRATFERRRD